MEQKADEKCITLVYNRKVIWQTNRTPICSIKEPVEFNRPIRPIRSIRSVYFFSLVLFSWLGLTQVLERLLTYLHRYENYEFSFGSFQIPNKQ